MDYTKAEAKQAARECFTGLWAATTTPFDIAGAVDYDALRRDLDRLTDGLEIDGIFCGGGVSEFWAPTESARRRPPEGVTDQTPGQCPVIAPTGHHAPPPTIRPT